MRIRTAICTVALLLASLSCQCAELFYLDHDPFTGEYVGPVGPLVFSGEIIPGDYKHLLSKIAADEGRFLAQNKLILASDGGDVAEALKIAALVKSLYTQVIVAPLTGRCVSACFFIYAAAVQREANGERLVGINRPFIADTETGGDPAPTTAPTVTASADATASTAAVAATAAAKSASATAAMATHGTDSALIDSRALAPVRLFLRENDVPGYLVEEMFRRASDDAYWLSEDDEKSLGIRSPTFIRYLHEKCAWDENIERDSYAGRRSMDDLKQKLDCRTRVTRADAHEALVRAATTLQRAGSQAFHIQ